MVINFVYLNLRNNMNPDQTATREQSDLGSYCLQNRQHKQTRRADDKSGDWERGMAKGLYRSLTGSFFFRTSALEVIIILLVIRTLKQICNIQM